MTKHDAERADRIADFYQFTLAETGKPPTVRETMRAVGLSSTSAVYHHLKKLWRTGRLSHDYMKARGSTQPKGACWCHCHDQVSD